jgi:hypothetical protein
MSQLAVTRALGLALAFTLTLSLIACGRDTALVLAEPAATTTAVGPSIPAGVVPNASAPDTSVPDASRTFAVQDAAARATASQDAAAALNKSGPPNTMSKEQVSKAMPLAGTDVGITHAGIQTAGHLCVGVLT